MNYQEYKIVSIQIKDLFFQMDKVNDIFSKATGISCVSTCGGVCCKNENVEVSPIDLIPLVVSLIESNQIEEIISLAREKENEHCLFFKNGKCTIYENRATLCRLFGYSSVFNKERQKVLSLCSYIKEAGVKELCPIETELAANIVEWSQKVKTLVPGWEQSTLPFNSALIYAAERVFTSYLYESGNETQT